MADVRLALLGTPVLEVQGKPVELERRKTMALLAYLAGSGRSQSRETLAALLWPEADESRARSGLRRELSILNKALGDGSLEIERDTIQLNPGPGLWIDTVRFEGELAACRSHGHATDAVCPDCLPHLREAASLYRADFMAGFTLRDSPNFDDWQHFQTESLRRELAEALARLVRGQGMQADFQAAIPYARRWVALDPLHEPTHRQLMELYARAGQRAAALHQYQECVRLLQEELGLPPAVETTALAERIRLETNGQHGRLIKNYELQELIGAGGFGEVYHAYQPLVRREVAIKVILPQFANQADFIRRFEAEAQLVAQLEHPHIVPLYDYWREPDGAYLVMRWLRGGSLEANLKQGGWEPEATARLLDQISGALLLAHQQGIVHRDIKPANILLDELGNGYLSDFGIAKNTTSVTQTQAELVIGSPAYLAPELINGEPVTPQADIYSLGIMLYQLLTGRHPFADTTPPQMIFKHLAEPLPSLHTLRPELPAALDEVIQQATAKDPAKRFPDVLALAEAVRRAMGLEGAQPEARELSTPLLVPNPYKGLRAFQESDAADFFGRTQFVEHLVARLAGDPTDPAARFLAVVGPSGSGKSSLVKAGLIPALRRGVLPGSGRWYIVEMTPGFRPLEELETAFLRIAVNPPATLLEQLQADERGLLRAVNRILPDDESELLLLIDQFEELFTLVETEAERSHFLESVRLAVTDPRSRLRVVITLRADFYDQPLLYPAFGDLLCRRMETILPLSGEELAQAITGPAERVGASLEAGLTAWMVAEVQSQPGMLPLLQYALTELFERRQGRRLTQQAYQASGGVPGALAQRAEALYSEQDDTGRRAVRGLFQRLVTLGEGTADTRRRVPRSELLSLGQGHLTDEDWSMESIIDTFGQYRLLTFDRDLATRNPTVEVAHEAILSEWGRLRQWLAEDRAFLLWQQRLRAALHQWQTSEQDDGALLRGAPLAEAENWFNQRREELSQAEQGFIQTGLAWREQRAAEQEAQRQRELETAQKLAEAEHRRAEEQAKTAGLLRRRAVFLSGALLVAAGLAVAAVYFGQLARQNAAQARREGRIATARELAAAAVSNLPVDPERSILLALQAVATTYMVDKTVLREAEEALHQAIPASRVRMTLTSHNGWVLGVAVSPDGSRVATASSDKTARIWDSTTGEALFTLAGHTAGVNSIAFSPDGLRLATASDDKSIKLWDAVSGQERLTVAGHSPADVFTGKGNLTGHTAGVLDVAFNPDGTRLATAGVNGKAIIWDAAAGSELLVLSAHTEQINELAFSPDGTRLATAGDDDQVIVWDAASGEALFTLSGHGDNITSVTFSPDGKLIASGSLDATARVWDAQTGDERLNLTGHASWVTAVAFSPDGSQLAAAGVDQIVLGWDLATGRELWRLAGHTRGIWDIAFSPDGIRLASASDDDTARIWDITPGQEQLTLAHTGIANDIASQIAFSPDGRQLATTGPDGQTVILWDAATGREQFILAGHSGEIGDIDFSPAGTRLATTSTDHTIRLWDPATGQEQLKLAGHTDWAMTSAFSPDGTRLATAGNDKLVRIWDTTTGQELLRLSGHTYNIRGVAFSPDGSRLATVGEDSPVRLWDAATGRELLSLAGHTDWVYAAAFSPAGDRLATGSGDTTVKLWDPTTGQEQLTLAGHTSAVSEIAFSPDGTRLGVTSFDGMTRVYVLPIEELVALAQSRLTRTLTAEECRQYLHVDVCPE